MDRASAEVTRLLQEWSNGQEQALDRLVPQIHRELRKLAAGARVEYGRFLKLWANADAGLPELAEAKRALTAAR